MIDYSQLATGVEIKLIGLVLLVCVFSYFLELLQQLLFLNIGASLLLQLPLNPLQDLPKLLRPLPPIHIMLLRQMLQFLQSHFV